VAVTSVEAKAAYGQKQDMVPPPSYVLWTVGLTGFIAAVGWAISQAIDSKRARQQLLDHIAECDKRARRNDELLTRIDSRLDELYKHGLAHLAKEPRT
jgi:hypothetical protein